MTHEPTSSARRASRNERPDRVVSILAFAVFAVVVLILSLLLYIVTTGVLNPPAPRTLVEKNLFMLEQVVQEKPGSVAAWADYVDASIDAGQLTQARAILDRGVAQLGEDVPELELADAKILVAEQEQDEALEQLDHTIEITLTFRESELARLIDQGITLPATLIKSEVIAEAAMLKAGVFYERDDWASMIGALDVALSEQPTNSDALIARGNAYLEQGNTEAARADYQQSLLYIPDYQPALDALDALDEGADQ